MQYCCRVGGQIFDPLVQNMANVWCIPSFCRPLAAYTPTRLQTHGIQQTPVFLCVLLRLEEPQQLEQKLDPLLPNLCRP